MSTHFRVTYATLSADNEELHAAYEAGLRLASSWLGADIPGYVSGEPRAGGPLFTVTSPGDLSLTLCRVHSATPADVEDAVRAASAAAGRWARTPWPERVAVLRAAADLISERSNELAALMSLEVGKNRLEALGDVEEAADLIRYYCQQVEDSDGFTAAMGTLNPREKNVSVLRPYGVWAVISPFNFPMALAAGPAGAALAAGNTVILKPSPQGSFTAAKLYECFRDAGLDPDVFHLLPGGDDVGAALVAHPGVSGLTFTGSYAVGMSIYRQFAGRLPQAGHLRDGRQEPGDRLRPRRPRRGGGRGGAVRVRAVRAEVLRVLAGLRAAGRARGVRREARRAGRVPGRRRPDVTGGVPRAGDQRRVGRAVRAGRRARAVRRRGRGRRVRAARRGRAPRRVLPRADRGDRAGGR